MRTIQKSSVHHVRVADVEIDVIEYTDPEHPDEHSYQITERFHLRGLLTSPRVVNSGPLRTRTAAVAAASRCIQQRLLQTQQ